MVVYRSPMEKIIDQNENNTVITNPKEPGRTFLRKLAYKIDCLKKRLFGAVAHKE